VILRNFDQYRENLKLYGGNAGRKLGIVIDGENWLLKFPKTTKYLSSAASISYTTSPLSEYIGSHVYELLGYDVHKTMLGIKSGKMVVACRDFTDQTHILREFREVKNYYNEKLEDMLEISISSSDDDANYTSLDALIVHLEYNPILQKVAGCKQRFWDCAVIDGLINNNDRNNGNWGILQNIENNSYSLAPIFDNGGSFNNKLGDKEFSNRLQSEDAMMRSALNTVTSYSLNDKMLTYKALLCLDNRDLKSAINRVYPLVSKRFDDIAGFIENIPEEEDGYRICSKSQKEFYIQSMRLRIEQLLKPEYHRI